jgi:hypothetical protein
VSHGPQQQMTAALRGVPLTPVISLLARHLASSRPNPIISDPAASALISRLGLSHAGGDWSFRAVEAAAAVRTGILDAAVRSWPGRPLPRQPPARRDRRAVAPAPQPPPAVPLHRAG